MAYLYLRSRRAWPAVATATTVIALAWVLWLAATDAPTVDLRLMSVTAMLAVTVCGATLGGADDDLDRTAAVNWPLLRAGHLLLAAAAISAPLLLSAVTDARFAPASLVLRNTLGLLGLAALGATLLGAARCWIAPLAWTLLAVIPVTPPGPELLVRILGWPAQPAGTAAATGCAAALAVAGLLTYARYGARHRPAATAHD